MSVTDKMFSGRIHIWILSQISSDLVTLPYINCCTELHANKENCLKEINKIIIKYKSTLRNEPFSVHLMKTSSNIDQSRFIFK